MSKRVLFVLTNHSQLGSADRETGFYLPELTHPYEVFTAAGYECDCMSPQGGPCPVDTWNVELADMAWYEANTDLREKVDNALKPSDVNAASYDIIFYVGGHGTMWDFPENTEIAELARDIYEAGGTVVAVCHGPAGLLPITLSDGSALVDGKRVCGFTNAEEEAIELTDVVPFSLEDSLNGKGATFVEGHMWEANVVVDQRVATGQNPASARELAEAVVVLQS